MGVLRLGLATAGQGALVIAAIVLSVVMFLLVPSTPLLAWLLAYGYDKGIAGGK